jgi:hypothetical protein
MTLSDGAVILADVGPARTGPRALEEPVEQEYGQRECPVEDLAGRRWQFTQAVRDVAPEDWGGVVVEP